MILSPDFLEVGWDFNENPLAAIWILGIPFQPCHFEMSTLKSYRAIRITLGLFVLMFYGVSALTISGNFWLRYEHRKRDETKQGRKPQTKGLQISPDKSSIWTREQKVKPLPDAEHKPPALALQDSAFPQHSLHGQRALGTVGWKSLELLSNLGGSMIP